MKPPAFGYRSGGGPLQTLKNVYKDTFGFGIYINLGIITGVIIILTISVIPLPFPISDSIRGLPVLLLILHAFIRWYGPERIWAMAGLIGCSLSVVLYQQGLLIFAFIDLMISFLCFSYLLKVLDNKFLPRPDWKVMLVGLVGGAAFGAVFWLYPKVEPQDSLPVFGFIGILSYFVMRCLFVRVRTKLVAFSGLMFMTTSAVVGQQAFQEASYNFQTEARLFCAYLSVFFLIIGIEHNYARDWKKHKKSYRKKRAETNKT